MNTDPTNLEIAERPDGIELTVKVVPGASRTKIAGVWGTALRITVAPAPEAGKANAAVVKLLASTFAVKRGDVQIVGGQTRPLKRVRVSGRTAEELRGALGCILARADGE